jgi:hypothetical protein
MIILKTAAQESNREYGTTALDLTDVPAKNSKMATMKSIPKTGPIMLEAVTSCLFFAILFVQKDGLDAANVVFCFS